MSVYQLLSPSAAFSTFSTIAIAVVTALVVSISAVGVWLVAIRSRHLASWAFSLLYVLDVVCSCTAGYLMTGLQ